MSPAVDAGLTNAEHTGDNGHGGPLSGRTTCTDGLIDDAPILRDTGMADIGFHYTTKR